MLQIEYIKVRKSQKYFSLSLNLQKIQRKKIVHCNPLYAPPNSIALPTTHFHLSKMVPNLGLKIVILCVTSVCLWSQLKLTNKNMRIEILVICKRLRLNMTTIKQRSQRTRSKARTDKLLEIETEIFDDFISNLNSPIVL